MPIKPELRKFYGHRWQTVDRPAALARAFWACQRCDIPDRPMGLKSALEGAHLDGNPANRSDDNVACLCHTCHRANDYAAWAALFRAWLEAEAVKRAARKDAERPILVYLQEAV